MFEEKYQKFKKTIEDFHLISDETKKIVIAMSGGKDAAAMAHFLMEYKKREHKNIELEMILAPVPHPVYKDIPKRIFNKEVTEKQKELLIKQKNVMEQFNSYWSKYIKCTEIPVQYELIDSRILNMKWSCIMCFNTKMKAFNEYLSKGLYDDNTLFACGWTKWDVHYALFSHLLKSDGSKWYEVKEKDPKKYKADCIYLASFAVYPKVNLGIPGKNIYRINPMVEFDDTETLTLSKELKVPIVEDICKELHGNYFEQDRRFISKYLEICSTNQRNLNLSKNSILFSYRTLIRYMQEIEIIPPLEEIEGLMYDAYDSDFNEVYELLKK